MSKRIIAFGLALMLSTTPAGALFSDVTDPRLAQTAAVLNSLGIMQGMGNDLFSPYTPLTRAQFCKMAVTSMGLTNVSSYRSYTIFPDVKQSHWAAQYVNAALRHPDLKPYGVIKGYSDGTFRPNQYLNFGELCTMLLRMLGYTEADVGPFWPMDYTFKAQALGLTDGIAIGNPKAVVSRADAAEMLLNTLRARGNDGSMLLDKVASHTVPDCVLLETGDTSRDLSRDEAIFYEGGTVQSARKTSGLFDISMIGTHGTLVIGKADSCVAGIIPDKTTTESYTLTAVSSGKLGTSRKTLRPNPETQLYISRECMSDVYSEMWSYLRPGDVLTLYYDNYGQVSFMAVLFNSAA